MGLAGAVHAQSFLSSVRDGSSQSLSDSSSGFTLGSGGLLLFGHPFGGIRPPMITVALPLKGGGPSHSRTGIGLSPSIHRNWRFGGR